MKNYVHISYTWYKSLDVALHCSASPSIKIIILMTLQSLKVKHYLFWFKLIICNSSYSFVSFNVRWVGEFSLAEFQLSEISQKINLVSTIDIWNSLVWIIDELGFFLPVVAWEVQVKVRFYFQSFKLNISN